MQLFSSLSIQLCNAPFQRRKLFIGQLMAHIGYGDRTAKLEQALDLCCNTEKKLVLTTDKDGATSEEFTTYLLDTLKTL